MTAPLLQGAWVEEARCRDLDVYDSEHIFFPQRTGRVDCRAVATPAVEYCAVCPVINQCARDPLRSAPQHRWGIWGGWYWRPGKAPIDLLVVAGLLPEGARTPPE